MKSVDRPELGADLGSRFMPAHGCTEGVADGHAEECAEELILCCVWHLLFQPVSERPHIVDAQPVES